MYKDGHHVLFERRLWEANQPGKALRLQPGLLVPMWRPDHEALHKEVQFVPPFPYRMGNTVLSLYRDVPEDHEESMENFLRATEQAMKRPWMSEIEKSIGGLAIWAMESQLPFIRES